MGILPLNVFSFDIVDRKIKLGMEVTDAEIAVRDGLGLPPSRELVKKLESAYRCGEFSRGGCKEAQTDITVFSDYAARLEKYKTGCGEGGSVDSCEEAFS